MMLSWKKQACLGFKKGGLSPKGRGMLARIAEKEKLFYPEVYDDTRQNFRLIGKYKYQVTVVNN